MLRCHERIPFLSLVIWRTKQCMQGEAGWDGGETRGAEGGGERCCRNSSWAACFPPCFVDAMCVALLLT